MSGLLNHARRIHAIFTWHRFNVGSEHTFILSFLDAYSYPSLTNKRLCCGSANFIQKHKLLICCNQITYYLNSFPLYCQVTSNSMGNYLKKKRLKDISPKKVKEKKRGLSLRILLRINAFDDKPFYGVSSSTVQKYWTVQLKHINSASTVLLDINIQKLLKYCGKK